MEVQMNLPFATNNSFSVMPLRYVNGKQMKLNSGNILDQYFTKQEVAEKLFEKAKEIIKKYDADRLNKFFGSNQASATGVFSTCFPKTKE